MANKRTQKKNKRHNDLRKKSQRQRNQRDTYQRGGTFSVPISKFYPQNMYETDPSRMMSVGGSRKNHSRKYLKRKTGDKKIMGGNSGFFSQFGAILGSTQTAQQVTGISLERPIEASSFKV